MSTKPSLTKSEDSSDAASSDQSDEQQHKSSKIEGNQDGSSQSNLSSQTSSPTKATDDNPIDQQSNDEVEPSVNHSVEETSISDGYEIGATEQISGVGQAVLLPIAAELNDQLTCAICADQFENSVMLHNCGHVFCKKCVMLCWQKVVKGPMECPLCRTCLNNKREHSTDKIREQIVEAFVQWKEDSQFKRGLSLAQLLAMEKNSSK